MRNKSEGKDVFKIYKENLRFGGHFLKFVRGKSIVVGKNIFGTPD